MAVPYPEGTFDVVICGLATHHVEDITLILGAESRPLARQPLALDDLARAAVEHFRVTADGAEIPLNSEIATDVSPAKATTIRDAPHAISQST